MTKTTATPEQQAQREAALIRANQIRIARAGVKATLGSDRTFRLAVAVLNGDVTLDHAFGLRVFDFLVALPRVGPDKARRLMLVARIHSPLRRLEELPVERRRELGAALASWAACQPSITTVREEDTTP